MVLRIQRTDVPGTAEIYAKHSPQDVVLVPLHGWDTIKPFIDHGRNVTIVGCIPMIHPDGCPRVREVVMSWPFADKIKHIIDCDEMAELLSSINGSAYILSAQQWVELQLGFVEFDIAPYGGG